ncbi:MAG: hypothetical protein JXR84_16070 [Anaerolineae bacterium]|nr:hypothetical protein [Anaerolineae bacterium]
MLKNASFELGQEGNACQVHRPDGVYQLARGEVDKPREWTVFYLHDKGFRPPWDVDNYDGWCEPEVKIIPKQFPFLDPPRISEGSYAIKFFTMWRIHRAGLFQKVRVNAGDRLRFTIDAHAWSSTDDNPQTSDGVGDGDFFALEGTATDDAQRNVTFKVGIDPTGGTDPFADAVIWGKGAHVYNAYHALPAVEAVAQDQYVTVFVIDQVLWRFKHNDVYFDNARLEVVPSSQPIQCPVAREPYERTYALLPPGYSFEWIQALEEVWKRQHFTIGANADDAFARINGVPKCTVLALNPSAWDVDLEALYQQHYPSTADSIVHYVPIEATTPAAWAEGVRAYHEPGPEPEPEPEEEPTIPADIPHFGRGTRIGYHTIIPRQVPQHVVALAQQGAVVPVCKFVDDWSGMDTIKAGSPQTLVVARKTFGGDEGVHGLSQMNETEIAKEAERLMSALHAKCMAERQYDGDRLRYIDYLESPINEADPPGAEGYAKLAKLMISMMDIAENWDLPVKKLALFSLNAGTPEWDEMVAMVQTGVFERMQAGGHILSLHEGALPVAGYSMETMPIDLWWGSGHTIPGAPVVPGSGALCCRYRYLLHLIRQRGLYVPILISEFYAGGGYEWADPEQVIQRMAWYDEQVRQDPEIIGVTPFTFGGKGVGWDAQDYDFMLPRLLQYTLEQKDRQNA